MSNAANGSPRIQLLAMKLLLKMLIQRDPDVNASAHGDLVIGIKRATPG